VATLNVKNFPDDLYQRLREIAEQEQRSIAQQVIRLLDHAVSTTEPRSIRELRGLGKPLWRDIQATSLVDEERRSWD
jgi:plasmid stability protein